MTLFNPWITGGGDKEAHTFAKGISLKLNVIAQLEFEFVYHKATVQYFSNYAIGIPPNK